MLINSVVYKDGYKLADIGIGEVQKYVSQPGHLVWVALRETDGEMLETLQQQLGLHPLAVEDARNGHQRPKIEDYGDSLFAVMHVIEPGGAELRVGEVAVFAGHNYVVTVRSHVERGFQEVRARCEREPELLRLGAGFVLYALTDAVVDRYFPVLDLLEAELESVEERIFSNNGSPRANIEALYDLKNRLMVVKHAVTPLLEGVSNLSGARVPALCTGLREYFRDIYDHLLRLNQTIESIRDSVATAISVNLSMISLQENETMKRLAAYAALIAVPTMVAGIYGMNFEHMPELGWRFGYAGALGVMAVIDVYLFYRLRKAKWL
ncbi:MAG: magnesium/cobalt transporter CorA [Steroidobacteraceae bacterium]|nr:magnesium/cobalt transporter CorA [Steroidobacteraceae bacterium]